MNARKITPRHEVVHWWRERMLKTNAEWARAWEAGPVAVHAETLAEDFRAWGGGDTAPARLAFEVEAMAGASYAAPVVEIMQVDEAWGAFERWEASDAPAQFRRECIMAEGSAA